MGQQITAIGAVDLENAESLNILPRAELKTVGFVYHRQFFIFPSKDSLHSGKTKMEELVRLRAPCPQQLDCIKLWQSENWHLNLYIYIYVHLHLCKSISMYIYIYVHQMIYHVYKVFYLTNTWFLGELHRVLHGAGLHVLSSLVRKFCDSPENDVSPVNTKVTAGPCSSYFLTNLSPNWCDYFSFQDKGNFHSENNNSMIDILVNMCTDEWLHLCQYRSLEKWTFQNFTNCYALQ